MSFLIRILINAVALVVAAVVLDFFGVEGMVVDLQNPGTLLIAAAIFGLVNALIRPILMTLSCLINFVTLGLFTLVINAAMLLLTGYIVNYLHLPGFQVQGFWAAFLGAIIISIVSTVLSSLTSNGD
jgi:putative membrane protein